VTSVLTNAASSRPAKLTSFAIRASILGVLCALSLINPPAAQADGDPASDILYAESAFIPADAGIPDALQLQLVALIHAASHHGYPIKVALIGSPADLGSDTALWPHPETYAAFLGTELSLVYHGPLLIVMPNGLAIYHLHQPVTREQRLLEQIEPKPGGTALATNTLTAIQRLADAAGHPLALPRSATTPEAQSNGSPVTLVMSVAALLLIGLAWTVSLKAQPPAFGWVRHTPSRRP
jgi:hypothetical protein